MCTVRGRSLAGTRYIFIRCATIRYYHKEPQTVPRPIELYYWPTPNGKKIAIFLEEADLPYKLAPVDITAGDQFEERFLRISPNNKMPAIVDPDGPDGEPISVFESGAILMYPTFC
jgi:hypothetical protein